MAVVVISRIRVVSGNAAAVAMQYQRRLGAVDGVRGFLGLEVLRPHDRPTEFWIWTKWESSADFEAYRKSPEFRQAHARIASIPGIVKIDKNSHTVERFDVLAR